MASASPAVRGRTAPSLRARLTLRTDWRERGSTYRAVLERTLAPGRSQVNMMETRKREHSRKPDEQYELVESCSPGPRLELFARGERKGWSVWGNQADEGYEPTWATYAYNSRLAAE